MGYEIPFFHNHFVAAVSNRLQAAIDKINRHIPAEVRKETLRNSLLPKLMSGEIDAFNIKI